MYVNFVGQVGKHILGEPCIKMLYEKLPGDLCIRKHARPSRHPRTLYSCIYTSTLWLCLCLCVCVSLSLSFLPSDSLGLSPSLSVYMCLSLCLYVSLPLTLFVCVSACLCLCQWRFYIGARGG